MPPKPSSSATWYLPPRRRACAVISSRVLRSSSLTLPQYFPPVGTGRPCVPRSSPAGSAAEREAASVTGRAGATGRATAAGALSVAHLHLDLAPLRLLTARAHVDHRSGTGAVVDRRFLHLETVDVLQMVADSIDLFSAQSLTVDELG